MNVDGFKIDKNDTEQLLGVKYDRKLTFDDHISDICKKAWMCHRRANNNKINKLHEGCLLIVYNDKQSSFNELLEIDGSVSIHIWNIQILATAMYKRISNPSPSIMSRVFKLNSDICCSFRQILQFSRPQVRSIPPENITKTFRFSDVFSGYR